MDIKLTAKNTKETDRLLGNEIANMDKYIQDVLNTVGNEIVEEAKSLAPVRTGYMRDHIRGEQGITKHTFDIESEAEYSIFVEYGTSKQTPQPFLEPAVLKLSKRFGDLLATNETKLY